jgi:ribosomal protein S18 acetylase RimI-like enzyme
MQFRNATITDADAIAGLHAQNWQLGYRGMLDDDYLDHQVYAERLATWQERLNDADPAQYVVVVEDEGRMVGFACAYGDADGEWGNYLDNLHVAPDCKGKNIGAQLMSNVAAWCEQNYPDRGLYLWVLEENRQAKRFYERLGGVKADQELWTPPGGGSVPTLRYVWRDLAALQARVAEITQ